MNHARSNNAINSDVPKRRFALLWHAGYGERRASSMGKHMKKLFVGVTFFLVGATASAGVIEHSVMSKLHNASKDIKQHTNYGSVVESIYKQIRSRANVSNAALNVSEIDRIVRSYVSEKYAPALITNYAQLYLQLKAAKSDFSTCDTLHPFNLTSDVLAALCVNTVGSKVLVEYQTNGYGKGWSTASIFAFTTEGDALKLDEIELFLKEGTKAYVEGL